MNLVHQSNGATPLKATHMLTTVTRKWPKCAGPVRLSFSFVANIERRFNRNRHITCDISAGTNLTRPLCVMNGPLEANSITCPQIADVEWPPVRVLHRRPFVSTNSATSGYFQIKTNETWIKLHSVWCYIDVSVDSTVLLTLRWV